MRFLRILVQQVDPVLLAAMLFLSFLGLITMYSYQGEDFFFWRQLIWLGIACGAFALALIPDYRFLRTGPSTILIYVATALALVAVLFIGEIVLGAQSRFNFGFFSLQPSDPAKIALIALLAKYFAKRHELIGDFKHILISGMYTFVLFALVFIQPDFGTALIIFFIWLGMVLVAGIRVQHLALVFLLGATAFAVMWFFLFTSIQQDRITTFLDPLSDMQGAGYNAYQSTVAVGSGELLGKGVGYGTQSKLLFLPEYQTDFIFAAFAEEWGLVGVTVLFIAYGLVMWRLMQYALRGASNFETLFAMGVVMLIGSHFFVHIGMNIGLLPVTGLTVPFLSYGGSHLVTEFVAVGMVMAMRRYARRDAVAENDSVFAYNS